MKNDPSSHSHESRSYDKPVIRPEMTVRQVATDYPGCRDIFVEYGESTGRPGKFGHFQPLTHFAGARGVDLDQLLVRLSQAAGVPVDRWSKTAEQIHRQFIIAALAITLTFGAGWGGWLLWRIGVNYSFDAVDGAYIVAHGEAQLWGFIGLFIAGISLRTVLINAVRSRLAQLVCTALFGLALLSIAGGFVWSLFPDQLQGVGVASAAGLLGLSLVFWSVQIQLLWPKWKTTWARAVIASGLWLTVWAATTFLLRLQAADAGPGSFSMAARQMLIELAVFGFAMNSIYGFGQMLLPGFLRTGRTRSWAIESAFWLHNLGVVVVFVTSTGFSSSALSVVGVAAIAAGTIVYAIGQHAFLGKPRTSRRPEQGHRLLDWYIPLAFIWLALSMLLLAGGHLYAVLFQVLPAHEFTGAMRHALTVGFMTTLILGVGQRFLPVLEHSVLRLPELVAPILSLIALGNLLRVALELGTLWAPAAFIWMPVSAVLEWTALLLFAVSVCSVFWRRDPLIRSGRVTERSSLAVLLAEHPWIDDRLTERGSPYLARARTVPRELTIGSFADNEAVPAATLVEDLNRMLRERGNG